MNSIQQLYERIKKLKNEKASLMSEYKALKKEAEGRAVGLECEVSALREEVEELKKILDSY